MTKRRTTNKKLTTAREHRKKYIIRGVVKRGSNPRIQAAGRSVRRVLKAVFFAALLAGLCYGANEGYRKLFWENPDYSLKEVRYSTDGSLTRDMAIAVTGFKEGRNIFGYRLDSGRDALKAMPQVENVEIRRYLPNRIEIVVTERKPVAWVTAHVSDDPAKSERSHLLDARGLVFKPKRLLPEYEPLPVIGGVEMGDIVPGKPLAKAEIQTALDLLRRTNESGDFKILSMDVSKGYCITVTDQKRAQLTFGLDDVESQLKRLTAVQREVALVTREVKTVNLMLARNIPVTYVISPDAEPEPVMEAPIPKPKLIGADPAKGAKPTPAGTKRNDKNKDTPKREGDVVLKKFRAGQV